MNNKGEIRDYDLKPMWRALLEIYDDFSKICERHGLRFYLAYGSALGVMRHGGFIPWDDDFDVWMPRPDYEKFIELAPREFPAYLKLRSWKLDPEYRYVFNKVVVTDRERIDRVRRESKLKVPQGLYIDIFPLDGAPKSAIGRKIYWLRRWSYWALGSYLLSKTEGKRMRYLPLYIIGWFMSLRHRDVHTSFEALVAFEKWAQRIPYSDDEYAVWCLTGYYYYFPPKCFGAPLYKPFVLDGHEISVPLPSDVVKALELEFGDWKSFPPEEDRVPWHQLYS